MTDAGKRAALALLAGTQFVLVLDAAIVNVALPSMGRDLDVAADDLSWVVNAYLLVFGGFLLLGGRLADYLGPRRMYVAGIVLFTAASIAGGLATSPLWLVLARAAQGLGAAVASPAALALLMAIFREGPERNRALGVWAGLGGSGGAAGAILGGLLTDGFGWEAVLFVNVPAGVFAVAVAPRLLPEPGGEARHGAFDVAGALLVTAGLASLVYALVDANDAGWASGQTLVLVAVAVVLLALFVAVEARSEHPLVPLRVFAHRPLRVGNVITLLSTAALFPMFFFVTLYTQDVLGYTPIESGFAQLPLAATIAASATFAPRLVARAGARASLIAGLGVLAGGLLWLSAIAPDGSFAADLLGPSLVVGAGAGLTWVATMVVATSGAAEGESGLASGLVNTAQQLGGAVGVAALVAVATARTQDAATGDRVAALTEGFSAGLATGAAIAAGAAVLAAVLLAGLGGAAEAAPAGARGK